MTWLGSGWWIELVVFTVPGPTWDIPLGESASTVSRMGGHAQAASCYCFYVTSEGQNRVATSRAEEAPSTFAQVGPFGDRDARHLYQEPEP